MNSWSWHGGGYSRKTTEALKLAVRSLVKRHFDQMMNRSVRNQRRKTKATL